MSQPQVSHLRTFCIESNNFTRPSTYHSNRASVLTSIRDRSFLGTRTYSNATKGLSPDTAYGMYLCRGDVAKSTCALCVRTATLEISKSCTYQKEAFIYYEECMIWSTLGCLIEVAGERGLIDLGIRKEWSVAEAWRSRRRRRHRVDHLNEIEEQLAKQRHQRTETNDIALWKGKNDVFTDKFSTKNTWNQIRNISPVVPWHKGVWFAYAIPKHSFCAWLAVQGKLSTGDRMMKWNGNVSGNCVLCANNIETRDHLFFSCSYVTEIWSALAKGLLKTRFTSSWSQLLKLASDNSQDRVEGLLLRYVFQATIYTVWRERNGRRHGETPNTSTNIIGWIDKQIRNQLTTIRRMGDRRYDMAFQVWLQARAQT